MTFIAVYIFFGAFLGVLGSRNIPNASEYAIGILICAVFWPLIIVASIVTASTHKGNHSNER